MTYTFVLFAALMSLSGMSGQSVSWTYEIRDQDEASGKKRCEDMGNALNKRWEGRVQYICYPVGKLK